MARESAFFKVEQEADLQRHRARLLLGKGRIEEIAGACLGPPRKQTFEESVRVFEVLPEVLQQQARIDAPDAAKRREYVRRIKAGLPELSPSEMQQYRSVVYGVAAAVGHVPRMTFGRNRYYDAYHDAISTPEPAAAPLQWSAQAREAGRRAQALGTRAFVYGSALGVLAAALAGTLAYRSVGIAPGEPLQEGLQRRGASVHKAIQQQLTPVLGISETMPVPASERPAQE